MGANIPKTKKKFVERFPDLGGAWESMRRAEAGGPFAELCPPPAGRGRERCQVKVGASPAGAPTRARVKWREGYATGVQRIDEQHKMLFGMSDDFRSALDEGAGERTYGMFVHFLDVYFIDHFRFEQRWMEKHGCPVARKNKKAHSRFLATLGDHQQRYVASGYLTGDARELVDALERWLDGHICHIDAHLKACVRK